MAKSTDKPDPKAKAPESSPSEGAQAQAAPEQNSTAEYDGTNILRKLSPKTVMGRIKRPNLGDPDASPPVPPDPPKSLYVVMGQTNGIKTGTSDNGPWTAFTGWFEAVRSDNGEVYQSGLCFVPKSFEELLLNAVKSAQAGDASAMVQFAVEIGLKPNATAAVGYEFTVKNLVKVQQGDPLKALRDSLKSANAFPRLTAAPASAS